MMDSLQKFKIPHIGALLVSFAMVLGPLPASSQITIEAKHPRVAELENVLVKDATTFLKSRFPNMPFLVSVSVDPLRRVEQKSRGSSERLPYFEEGDEEIQDEWDNPKVSIYALMARVKKTSITVSVASNVTDEEVSEVRTSLIQVLNLTAARDEVQIQKRAWSQMQDKGPTSETVILFTGIGFAVILVALAGLFVITRSSIKTIGSAIGTQAAKAAGGAGGGSAGGGSIPSLPSESSENRRGPALSGAGDLKFSDPLRMREVVLQSVRILSESPEFPNLQDMILLDRAGKKNSAVLGALLTEFSGDLQKRVFSYSSQMHWLQAMTDPGEITSEVMELLGRLMRNARGADQVPMQKLLIYVWRLDDQIAPFLRSIENEDALALLTLLPKTISVAAAREAFPGNWGAVLDTNMKAKVLTKERIDKLSLKAMQLKPLRDISILDQYRQERDLLEYLLLAEPQEEREIYLASPPTSVIHAMRPPFYRVFELTPEELDLVVPKISLDDWAMALLNTNRNDRREIEKKFSEKQRFVFIERLRKLDQAAPEKSKVGLAREKIARFIKTELSNANTRTSRESTTERDGNENQAA